MRYTLAVLTHGQSTTLDRAMESFWENVSPWPSEKICVRDGNGRLPGIGDDHEPWRGVVLVPQQGFCAATRALWRACVTMGTEYVFWLEHDFVFTRALDLRELADVLDDHPTLSQMHLIREPVNDRERKAGGIVPMQRADYEQHDGWMEHRLYHTTNPSLMRRDFMRDNPWPDYDSECEGKFSWDLRALGFSTGAWGEGEPWVEHIGERDGFGY